MSTDISKEQGAAATASIELFSRKLWPAGSHPYKAFAVHTLAPSA